MPLVGKAALLSNGLLAAAKTYVDDVFSTYLYTGDNTNQQIVNGIDLATYGGLIWEKDRTSSGSGHFMNDTVGTGYLDSSTTNARIGTNPVYQTTGYQHTAGTKWAANTSVSSWTFRKAPKFFDVVQYTGNGANRTIAHSLGVAPGCIMVKRTDATGEWRVYHRSIANTQYLILNSPGSVATGIDSWNSTTATSTGFRIGTNAVVNANGGTYVAYLFAHDPDAVDGMIQCGSFTTDGNASATLGWEPQYLLIKSASNNDGVGWQIYDTMRGWVNSKSISSVYLSPNSSAAEAQNAAGSPSAGGFTYSGSSGATYIYIAIRRPNKPPTTGTQVFAPVTIPVTGQQFSIGFPADLVIERERNIDQSNTVVDRLRGGANYLYTDSTSDELFASSNISRFDLQNSFLHAFYAPGQSVPEVFHAFRRAPGFFDVVAYTGAGASNRSLTHNLGAPPELCIFKSRSFTQNWYVSATQLFGTSKYLNLNSGSPLAAMTGSPGNNPTATTIDIANGGGTVDVAGERYIAYLFATLPGISKVGTYTGNGSSQTINCGFTTGARFILIKRTDSTGDWYVWDTARGIIAANDPHLSLNTLAAEVTTDDSVDPASTGFIVNQVAATNINVNGATYIYFSVS